MCISADDDRPEVSAAFGLESRVDYAKDAESSIFICVIKKLTLFLKQLDRGTTLFFKCL
jgi:hypothetical protein